VTQLTTDLGNDGAPDWSPDGTRIAFQSNRSGNNDIWIIPATGGVAMQVTTASTNDVQPDWAPNDNEIVYASSGSLWIATFGSVDVSLGPTVAVSDISLGSAHPNPFSSATKVLFGLPSRGHTRLLVFNVLGQRIRTLTDSSIPPGRHGAVWDGRDEKHRPVPSGTYFIRLEANGETKTRKVVHIR
jgi:dipeptidyl aminopeptidase/acylaminoacyl peptidase